MSPHTASLATTAAPHAEHGSRATARLVALACAFAATQLALHLWNAVAGRDPRMMAPHAVAWLQDLLVLALLLAVAGVGAKVLARWSLARRLWLRLTLGLLFVAGLALASYPRLLSEFLAFPVDVFAVDGKTARFFVTEYLGWSALWPLLLAVAGGLIALRLRWRLRLTRTSRLVAAALLALSCVTLLRPAPQPFVRGAQDTLTRRFSGRKRVVPSLLATTPSTTAAVTANTIASPLEGLEASRYDHVLLLVMEGVTRARFEREFLGGGSRFLAREGDHAVDFTNYHTTNLDSYTSLIAMATSEQVPYRAYADAAVYRRVNRAPNVVAALRRRGFATMFISTYEEQPFVPVPDDWDRVLDARNLSPAGMVRVGVSRMEAALEDRAALPAIVEFVTSHRRTLVLHEMAYGHSPEWIAKTGTSQLAYDDAFLCELLDCLERAGVAERTLLVVVSDHGDRSNSSDPENYHIPLLVAGPGIAKKTDSAFRSHLDFQAILGHFLGGSPLPPPADSLLTVGSTERWVYGEITSKGASQFIEEESGTLLGSRGGLDPLSLYRRFAAALASFTARYRR